MHVLPYTMPRSMLRANLAIAYADQAKLTDATVRRTYDMMLASGVRSAIVARMGQVVLPDPVPLLRRLNMPTALPPIPGSPEARVFGLLLCPQFLDHLRLEFSASLACGGLAAPPAICSKIGGFCPIPLWGRSSL